MPGPSPDVCTWLVSAEGVRTVAEATARLEADDVLGVGTQLRARGIDPDRAAAATSAAVARLRARERYPDADRLLFTTSLLEQASHPAVSSWRAGRFPDAEPVLDLCCGAGADAMALAGRAPVVAVDRDPVACTLARHNLAAAGARAQVVLGDATSPPVRSRYPIHVDPARRDGARRARSLADYRPAVAAIVPVLRAAVGGAAITISPGVALDDPDLPPDGELEFVQVGNDLVEAVVWLGELRAAPVTATATLLGDDGALRAQLRREEEPEPLPVRGVGAWLIEVAPAVVRSRLHDRVGAACDAWRVAARRALLSSDRRPPPSPVYRTWQVEAVLPARARDIRAWLRRAEPLPLEVATHGMGVDPETLLTGLGSPARGPSGRRLHLVRLDDGAAAVATRAT